MHISYNRNALKCAILVPKNKVVKDNETQIRRSKQLRILITPNGEPEFGDWNICNTETAGHAEYFSNFSQTFF